jgi:hypothetical protein
MTYGCLKITRCSEDSFRVEKQGNTLDSGDIGDNATWVWATKFTLGALKGLMVKNRKKGMVKIEF